MSIRLLSISSDISQDLIVSEVQSGCTAGSPAPAPQRWRTADPRRRQATDQRQNEGISLYRLRLEEFSIPSGVSQVRKPPPGLQTSCNATRPGPPERTIEARVLPAFRLREPAGRRGAGEPGQGARGFREGLR